MNPAIKIGRTGLMWAAIHIQNDVRINLIGIEVVSQQTIAVSTNKACFNKWMNKFNLTIQLTIAYD